MALETTLEAALAAVEREADPVLKSAASVTKELRKARMSAKSGQIRDLRRALQAASSLGEQLARSARELRESFDFDEQEYLSSGDYAKELMAASQAADVAMFEEDERLLCYPSLVRILPGEAAVEIDRVRERRLRPSVLVAQLSATQQKAPRFRPEPFLDSLCSAYELVVAREGKQHDAVVRLIDVWSVLTM
ncbi:MAG: hypothetical protein ACREXP_30230, partial [Steroidobacteraceae bacterium]